jgi:hypothetical protein
MLTLVCVPSITKKHHRSSNLGKPVDEFSTAISNIDQYLVSYLFQLNRLLNIGYLNLQVPQI